MVGTAQCLALASVLFFGMSEASPFYSELRTNDIKLFPMDLIFKNADKRDQLPTPLGTLVQQVVPNKEYDFGPGCKLSATTDEKATVLEAKDENCPTKPSLKLFLDTVMPDMDLIKASIKFICPDCYFFLRMSFDKTTKIITLAGAGKETIRLMNPHYFQLRDAKLTVSFNSESLDADLKDLDIELLGVHSLKGHAANMKITKAKAKTTFNFDLKIKSVPLGDLLRIYGIQPDVMTEPNSGVTAAPYNEMSFNSPTVKGIFTIQEENNVLETATLQMVASSEVENTQAFRKATIFVVVNKVFGLEPKAAIIAAVPSAQGFNTLSMVKKFLVYPEFIPEVVMLRKFKDKYLLIISQADIAVVNDESFVKLMSPYMKIYDTHQIVKGLSVQVLVPLVTNMKECSKEQLHTTEEEKDVLITFKIKTSGMEYNYPEKFQTDLKGMLDCLNPDIASKLPTQLFPDATKLVRFKDVAISPTRISLSAVMDGPFELAGGVVVIKYIHLEVDQIKKPPGPWTFRGFAPIDIGPIKTRATIEKMNETYTVTALVESLMIEDLLKLSGDDTITSALQSFGPLKEFGVKSLRIIAKFGDTKLVRVVCQPILFGLDNLYMETLIFKETPPEPKPEEAKPENTGEGQGGGAGGTGGGGGKRSRKTAKRDTKPSPKKALALAILMREIKFTKLLESICGKPVLDQGWMDKVTAYLIYSSAETKTKFSLIDLREEEIKAGLTLSARLRVPDDCKGSQLCTVLQDAGGKAVTLFIKGTIAKTKGVWSFSLSAGVTGSRPLIPNRLTLTGIIFGITINGRNSKIELTCKMNYKHDDLELRFTGSVSISLTGKLTLSFAMAGRIMHPFGIKQLGIGDINMAIGIQVPNPIPSIEMGAEIWIGDVDSDELKNDHVIKLSCYFGIDTSDPTNNYIFTRTNKLTFGTLFTAFRFPVQLPQLLADSGFPDGLFCSFTSNEKGKLLKGLSVERFISPGLFLKGTLNILGYTVKATIALSPTEIKVDIKMARLELANGLIILSHSEEDKERGPEFYVLVNSNTVTAKISGYISLLGMSQFVSIYIDDTSFRFNLTSNLFDIIRTHLFVQADYGILSSANFQFVGKLQFSLQKIAEELRKFLAKVRELCVNALDRATKAVDNAKVKVAEAKATIDRWKSNVENFRRRNDQRIRELEEKKKEMQGDCKAKCGTVCIPFLSWKSHCRKILWWWVGCLYWDSCKFTGPNLPCIIGCEAKKFFNKVGASIEQFGLQIANALSYLGDFVLNIGKDIVGIGDRVLDLAKGIVEGVKEMVKFGLDIVDNVATFALERLLVIHNLEVFGSLDADFTACMGLKCNVTLFGAGIAYDGEICINLNFYNSLSGSIADKKYPGVSKVERDLHEEEGRYTELKEDMQSLQNEINKGESKVNSELTKAEKRVQIPSPAEREAMHYNPFPDWVMKQSDIMDILSFSSPWALAGRVIPENLVTLPIRSETLSGEKRDFENEKSDDSCKKLHAVIARYDEVVHALRNVSKEVNEGEKMFQAYDDDFAKNVDHVKRTLKNIETTYNLTNEEREDLYFWYNTYRDGYENWRMKANDVLRYQRRNAIPIFTEQVNFITQKTYNQDAGTYLRSLQSKGTEAMKRSTLGTTKSIAPDKLDNIGQTLVDVLENRSKPHGWTKHKVKRMQADLTELKDHMKSCSHAA